MTYLPESATGGRTPNMWQIWSQCTDGTEDILRIEDRLRFCIEMAKSSVVVDHRTYSVNAINGKRN